MPNSLKSKRSVVGDLLARVGLTELYWRMLTRGLYCFNYHRIGNRFDCQFDRGVYSCSEDHFREHVALLKERFEIVGLARLLEISGSLPSRKPLALITFDDGYADNFELAFPILKEFGVTAAFFIPTAFIGGSRLPWWDEIAWSLRNATARRIRLSGSDLEFDLNSESIERSIRAVLKLVKRRELIPMDEQVSEIYEVCRPNGAAIDAGHKLFIGRDQLREMRRAGMDIGSHTHTHRILSHLDSDLQSSELAQSKAIIEEIIEEPVLAVAYPVGSPTAYSSQTCDIAKSLGYRIGFSYRDCPNRLPIANIFEVHRLSVSGDPGGRELKSQICFPWLHKRSQATPIESEQ